MKNGLIAAATNLGFDGNGERGLIGFLEYLGMYHTKSFCHLLGKVIPLQINAGASVQRIGTINVVTVPAGEFLSGEQANRLQPAFVIEHDVERAIEPDDQQLDPIEELVDDDQAQ